MIGVSTAHNSDMLGASTAWCSDYMFGASTAQCTDYMLGLVFVCMHTSSMVISLVYQFPDILSAKS